MNRPVIAGRVTKALHDKIQAAAKESGRTMSEELAHRVEQSFSREDVETMLRRVLKEQAELHYATRSYPGVQQVNGWPKL